MMGNIIRRNKVVPVEARRVEPPPDVISIPGAGPIPVPPATPGVTQNIIYVNVPQPQAAPPPQAPPPADPSPREVHYHTTNVYQSPRRRDRGLGTSFLGTLGFVLGGIAAGAAYLPPVIWLAKPIAMGGLACAAMGLLGAILLGRVGRVMPVFGLLACALAYGLWLKNTGQPIEIPKIDLNLNQLQSPAAPVPVPPAPSKPAQTKDTSIFGSGGNWVDPSKALSPALPTTPIPTAAQSIDLTAATTNLEKAREVAAARMGIDYASAKAAAVDQAAKYQQAEIDYSSKSPELVAAHQQQLDADSKLKVIEAQLRNDPDVAAAEAAVKTAKSKSN